MFKLYSTRLYNKIIKMIHKDMQMLTQKSENEPIKNTGTQTLQHRNAKTLKLAAISLSN
jgi:hypothetical protein